MEKFTVKVDPEPFEMVPHWILLHPTLTLRAKMIWLILRKYRNYADGTCYPSRKTIADLCGLSTKTVDRELPNLVAVGAISIEKRQTDKGDQDTNLYHVFWEPFGVIHRGRDSQSPPRVRQTPRGRDSQSPKLIPIDNKEVPQSILTMDDGPEHDAAYLRFIKGQG